MRTHLNSREVHADEAVRAPIAPKRGRPRSRRLTSHVGQFAISLCVISWCSSLSLAQTPAPFLRLRETTLGYHGPSADFTNLTEIRLGWFGPTNLNDPLNGDLWWAANFAIREANAHTSDFGLRTSDFARLPIRLIPRWAVDPWGTGVSQLTRMVYDEQPLALLGSADSATTHLAEQVVAKANLPLVSPISTDKSVTLAGVSWMFSCAPSDAAIARVLAAALLESLPTNATGEPQFRRSADGLVRESPSVPERADEAGRAPGEPAPLREAASRAQITGNKKSVFALLACTDHESRMTTREVLKELSRRGRMPDFRFDVPPGAQNITPQLSALAAAQPRAVIIVAGAEDSARLVQAIRERLSPRDYPLTPALSPGGGEGVPSADAKESQFAVFGTHTMSRTRFLDLAGSAAEGVRFPLLFAADSADTNAARFIARFQSERRHPPDYTAALAYDATRLLIEAIRRAGPNRSRIREQLVKLSPWSGVAGSIAFDGTGQNSRKNLRMGTIRDGAIVPLDLPSSPPQASHHKTSP